MTSSPQYDEGTYNNELLTLIVRSPAHPPSMTHNQKVYAAFQRAAQAHEHRNANRVPSAAMVQATASRDPKPPPLPHIVPINKLLQELPKRNMKEEDEVIEVPVQRNDALDLPKHIAAPIDCWRVALPLLPNGVNPRPVLQSSRRQTKFVPPRRRSSIDITPQRPIQPVPDRLGQGTIRVAYHEAYPHISRHVRPVVEPRPRIAMHPLSVPHRVIHVTVEPGQHTMVEHAPRLPMPICKKSIIAETPGLHARRKVATLLQAAAIAGDQVFTPEQIAKLTKRMLNRASVQKCRRKQRERASRLESERVSLTHDNTILQNTKSLVENTGVLDLVRQVRAAQAAGGDAAAVGTVRRWTMPRRE